MPRTVDRPEAVQAPQDQTQTPQRIIPHDWDRRQGIERWVRWLAFGVFAVLAISVGLWAWFADGGEPVAADYPDCWPLCSYAATVTEAGVVTEVAPADYPDCWPLCVAAAQAEATSTEIAPAIPATGLPDCHPLCSHTLQPADYPDCWPLCSYTRE